MVKHEYYCCTVHISSLSHTMISHTAIFFLFNSFHALLHHPIFPLCLNFICKLQPPPQPHTHTRARGCLSCRPPSVGSNEGGRVLFWLHACAKFSLVWQLMERERSVNLIKDLPLLITACQVAVLIAAGSTFASLTLFFILHSFSSFLLFVCIVTFLYISFIPPFLRRVFLLFNSKRFRGVKSVCGRQQIFRIEKGKRINK